MRRAWLTSAFVTVQATASIARAEPDLPALPAEESAPPPPPTPPTSPTPPEEPAVVEHDELARLRERVERLEAASAKPPPKPPQPLLRPSVLAEADHRIYPAEAEGNTGFALARLRPGLMFTPTTWFLAATVIEFAGEPPQILDAFMRLRATEAVEFTVGASKPPLFPSFVYEPVQSLPFPDRAPVVTSFRVQRDVGADVHLSPHDVPLEGWLRVGNGTGSPLGNDNMLPAGYAALDLVLGRAWIGGGRERETLGLRTGAAMLVESAREYPELYWACNNQDGLHVGIASSVWDYASGATPPEPMEVYVR